MEILDIGLLVLIALLAGGIWAIEQGGLKYLKRIWQGKKSLPDENSNVKHPNTSYKIHFEFPETGKRMVYNGKIHKSDGEIGLTDENGQVCEIIKEKNHYLSFPSLFRILEGDTEDITIRVVSQTYASMLQTELESKNMQIAQLLEQNRSMSLSFNKMKEQHARDENKIKRIEQSGIRQIIVKPSGKSSQSETLPDVGEE